MNFRIKLNEKLIMVIVYWQIKKGHVRKFFRRWKKMVPKRDKGFIVERLSKIEKNVFIKYPKSKWLQQKIVARLDAFFEKYEQIKEEQDRSILNETKLISNSFFHLLNLVEGENKRLQDICDINPKKSEIKDVPDSTEVSFIPMNLIDEKHGIIKRTQNRKIGQVRKGYTYFKEGDILFAKITPCMENKNSVIANGLYNGIGFGSTEFFVLRPKNGILPEFIYYLVRQEKFISDCKMHMAGTAGQLRVPKEYLENYEIKIPPKKGQEEIIRKMKIVETKQVLVSEAIENMKSQIELFPKSVLAKAFSSELLS